MNKFLLFLVLLPKGLWRSLGADIHQLRAILQVRLKLDDRRPMAMGRQSMGTKKKKPVRFMTWLSVFISAVIGFMYTVPLILEDTFMGLWLYYSMFLVMLSIMLISDFSSVLFDSKDKLIILPRPVNEKTYLLSRMLHMVIYLFRIVLPMSLPGWIIMGVGKGWKAALWFPYNIIMLTFLALFIVNGAYLLIMKLSRPGKFKDVLSSFQILFSIAFFVVIYTLPSAVRSPDFLRLSHDQFPWAAYTPTYWLAASWSWIQADKVWSYTPWLSILSFSAPFVLMWVTVRSLAPVFARRMADIDTTEVPVVSKKEKTKRLANPSRSSLLYLRFANTFNKSPFSRAGFIIAWLQTGRSRNFRLRVYPMFAYVPVYVFYLLTQSDKPLSQVWRDLPSSSSHILLLYMTSMVVLQLLSMLVYSDQYKASWIYYSSPVPVPGAIMAGAFKAVWIKYFLPMFVLVSLFVLSIWGVSALLDIALAFINVSFFALVVMQVAYRRLPFSSLEHLNEKSNRFLKTMFIMLLPMSIGFGHYWANITPFLWWLKIVFMVLSGILFWMLWDSFKNTSWEQVKKINLSDLG